MPALLDGNRRRWQKNANYAEVLGADVDNDWTKEDAIAHPFIHAYCGLGTESSNSKPEHHKFRLVFRLPRPIGDWRTLRICNRYLIEQLPVADKACKDANRFFFGGKGRSPFLLNEKAILPDDFIERAIAWNQKIEEQEQRKAEEKHKRWLEWKEKNPDASNEIEEALRFISPYTPGENRYGDLIAMIGGILSDCGPEGEALLQEWDGGRGQWGNGRFDRILRSVAQSQTSQKATVGTLFYLAKQEGWQPPKRKSPATKQFDSNTEAYNKRQGTLRDRFRAKVELEKIKRDYDERTQRYYKQFGQPPKNPQRKRTEDPTVKDGAIVLYEHHNDGRLELPVIPSTVPTLEEWEKRGRPTLIVESEERPFVYKELIRHGFPVVLLADIVGGGKSKATGIFFENWEQIQQSLNEPPPAEREITPDTIPTPEHWRIQGKPSLLTKASDRPVAIAFAVVQNGWDLEDAQAAITSDRREARQHRESKWKTWYASNDYRNPSNEMLEAIPKAASGAGEILEHNKRTPMGNPYHRRANPGETPDIEPLCIQENAFQVTREKGHVIGRGKKSPHCKKCPAFDSCAFLAAIEA
ncbi:hypothetical protein [Vacuolonema iberomarrocanum]|uniref:hypothetical protein n=1 Tax=Vacuolonema iberomarrocanum TaxID=3454632 RepID=UPI003F6DBF0C